MARELTREEKRAIHKLVKSLCANYDKDYGCLPLDCECFMLGKCIASTSPGFIVLHIPSFALLPAIHIRSYCIRKKAKLLSTCCHRRIFVVRPFGAENPS